MKNSEHPVRGPNTPVITGTPDLDRVDWDDLRLFLDVAAHASLRAAAEARKLSVNTVRARIERLEAACGTRLLDRTREGSSVTPEGARLLEVARGMRHAAAGAAARPAGDPRQVRLASSEGLGLLWLTPRVAALADRVDGTIVELAFSYDFRGAGPEEADVAISFQRPDHPGREAVRLGTLHYMMFASPAYVARSGTPAGLHEAARHRLVEQAAPGLNTHILEFMIAGDTPPDLAPIRTNSSAAQLAAVEAGAGIAAMPTYVAALAPHLVPIDPPLNLRFDIYAAFQSEARERPLVAATLDWLAACFAADENPWFRHEFIHPRDFAGTVDRQASSSMSQ
jgi:DNA-binding transcriptional LysR family regulator